MEVKRASSATILKVVIVLLSVLIVALVVFAVVESIVGKGIDKPSYNIMVMGLDDASNSTDVMMIAHVDENKGTLSILQIPRDLYINKAVGGYKNISKANSMYAASFSYFKNTLAQGNNQARESALNDVRNQFSEALGVNIDFYVLLDTDSFVYIIDKIGGVEYDVPVDMDYDDDVQDLHIHLKAGKQFPFRKSHNRSKLPVLVAGGIQCAAPAQVFYGVENFILLVFPVVITIRIEVHYTVFVYNHMFLLHQQHIRRAKTGDAVKAVRPLRPADYAPEQGGDFIEKRMVHAIAFAKSVDRLIIEEAEQGLGCDNIFAAADQLQNIFVIRRLIRGFCMQLLQEPFIPFPDGRYKNDEPVFLQIIKKTGTP